MKSTFGVGHCSTATWLLAVEPSATRVLRALTEALAATPTTLVLVVVSPRLSVIALEVRASSELTPLLTGTPLLAAAAAHLLLVVPGRLLGRLDRRLSRWGEVVPPLGPSAHCAAALLKEKKLFAYHLVWGARGVRRTPALPAEPLALSPDGVGVSLGVRVSGRHFGGLRCAPRARSATAASSERRAGRGASSGHGPSSSGPCCRGGGRGLGTPRGRRPTSG